MLLLTLIFSFVFCILHYFTQRDDNRELERVSTKLGEGAVTPMNEVKRKMKGTTKKKKTTTKKKAAPKKKLVENVKEATPWKQNVAWIATADDNAAAMARGSWWLLMTLPMLCLN